MTAIANDFGYERVFARQVEAFVQPGDVVVGITTSGNSPQHRCARSKRRKRLGATTIAFTGNGGGPLAELADIVLVGPRRLLRARARSAHHARATSSAIWSNKTLFA